MDKKNVTVARQFRQAREGRDIVCGCGKPIQLLWMYRCFYCGEYYCAQCAPEHFGKTKEEYLKNFAADKVHTSI